MELSNRIAEVFKQYYDMLDDIIWTKRQEDELIYLQNKANALIDELKITEENDENKKKPI